MDHYPYLTLNDNTEITYSDIRKTEHYSAPHIMITCETPDKTLGFKSAYIDYPFTSRGFYDISGYSKPELEQLMYHIKKIAKIAYEMAEERCL